MSDVSPTSSITSGQMARWPSVTMMRPIHPHLLTFPNHKHIGDSVVEAQPPDLADILREIESLIYPNSNGA